MATKGSKTGKKRITLLDVIAHMQHMEQRLSVRIDENTKGIAQSNARIDMLALVVQNLDRKFTHRIDNLERNLTLRMDALQEDLTATMKDFIKIRSFVGMPAPDEE